MSDEFVGGHDPHAGGPAHDDAASHGDDHGSVHEGDDGHGGHGELVLGPVDIVAWTFGLAGVVVGLIMWVAFAIATS